MYTREDFIKSGSVSSPENYDKIIRQLRDLYFYNVDDCEKAVEADTESSGKHKRYKFRRNYFESPGEQLVAVYGLYAVSEASVDEIIRCLCAAGSSQTGITVSGLSLTCPVNDESAPSPESRIRRRLDKLCEYGYLTKRGKYYKMKDMLAELSDIREWRRFSCASRSGVILWHEDSKNRRRRFCSVTAHVQVFLTSRL